MFLHIATAVAATVAATVAAITLASVYTEPTSIFYQKPVYGLPGW